MVLNNLYISGGGKFALVNVLSLWLQSVPDRIALSVFVADMGGSIIT